MSEPRIDADGAQADPKELQESASFTSFAYAIPRQPHRPNGPAPAARSLEPNTVQLLQAAFQLTSSLQVSQALRSLAESACKITGATWGAITVPEYSRSIANVEEPVIVGNCGIAPQNLEGLFAPTPHEERISISNNLWGAAAFTGAIEEEEPGSLLYAPLCVHDQLYGRLYLCDKPGGFNATDVTVVNTLAQAGAIAVENARLYRTARVREEWIKLAQEVTTMLLSGAEQTEVLKLMAQRICPVANAQTACLITPSINNLWLCELAYGKHSEALVGAVFSPHEQAIQTLRQQSSIRVSSLHEQWETGKTQVAALADFGPALYTPLIQHGEGIGVAVLLRDQNAPEFTEQELEITRLFAGQTAMAFELADAQHAEEIATLLNERARVGRDLHDLVIQQLFATGMQLSAAKERLLSTSVGAWTPETVSDLGTTLDASLASIDDSVSQIRSIIHSLHERETEVGIVERLRRETSLARALLGYAPSLLLSVDGYYLTKTAHKNEILEHINSAISADIADDMVAVVKEGLANVARHAHADSVTINVKITGILSPQFFKAEENTQLLIENGFLPLHTHADDPDLAAQPAVEITCCDDGIGIEPVPARHSGTANIAARAAQHGGSFTIAARRRADGTKKGTCFTWWVPLPIPGKEN